MHRERPLHPITRKRKREGRRGSRRMACDIECAQKEMHRIEYMSPEEYIEKTGLNPLRLGDEDFENYYDIEKRESRPIEELGEHIEDPDTKVRIPFVGDRSIFGVAHEGRHRAYAAMLEGEKEIPVVVPLDKDEREELAEEFISKRFPGHPDEPYLNEWRERFKGGFPESSMDKEGRDILKGILEEREIEEPE